MPSLMRVWFAYGPRRGRVPSRAASRSLVILLLGVAASDPPVPAWSAPCLHSVADLSADLRRLRSLLESQHPALYAFTGRATFDSLFARAHDAIRRPMTSREFYQIAAPIVARVGCGHTSLTMATDSLLSYGDRFLPLRLFVQGDRAFVRAEIRAQGSRRDAIPPGAELLTVNGVRVSELLARMRAAVSADGGNDGWKTAVLNGDALYDLYARLVGSPGVFEFTFCCASRGFWGRPGLGVVCLPAVSRRLVTEERAETAARHLTGTGDPHIGFAVDGGRDLAVLTIRTFAYYKTREKFYAVVDGAFERIRALDCESLILDLRGNSGGDPFCSAYLLAHLTPVPVPYFARAHPSYASLAQPASLPEHGFRGRLCTLIDGGCVSSTGHLCALLRHHRIGTFVGSETGATYECNDAARTDTLAATGLRLRVARTTFTAAVEGMPRGIGVQPDHPVQPAARDIVSGRDRAMERARSVIRRGAATKEPG